MSRVGQDSRGVGARLLVSLMLGPVAFNLACHRANDPTASSAPHPPPTAEATLATTHDGSTRADAGAPPPDASTQKPRSLLDLLNAETPDPNAPKEPWGRERAITGPTSMHGAIWGDRIDPQRARPGAAPAEAGVSRRAPPRMSEFTRRGFMVRLGDVTMTGSFGDPRSRPGIRTARRVLRQQLYGRIQWCYEDRLRANPELEGTVCLRQVLDSGGGVKEVSDEGSTLPDPEVVACVAKAMARARFPRVTGDASVRATWVLTPSSRVQQ